MAAVEIRGIRKGFGDLPILRGIDLDIADGEIVVFVGPSGCGKSTLLRTICGLETADEGTVLIGGRDMTHVAPAQRGIAMVFQSYALYPHMTVFDNMGFALKLAGLSRDEIRVKVEQAAATLRIEPLLQRKPKAPKPASAPEPGPDKPRPVVAAASTPAPPERVAEAPTPGLPEAAASATSATTVAAASPASAASAAGPAFEWPASTRMTYLLTGNYRGEVSGSAQVEWVRSGSNYQVHVDFIVGPSFAPLITQRSSSDGEITAEGLAPRRYDQDVKVLMKSRPRQTIVFDGAGVVLANGDVRPAVPGLQDTASQFVQLTYMFSTRPELLQVGGRVDIPLALPKKVAVWTYDVVKEEVLDTPFGPLTGIHLKPRTNDQKAGTLSVEMWMAPQLRYLPVRIRFEQDAQTYVDMIIAKPPEIAN